MLFRYISICLLICSHASFANDVVQWDRITGSYFVDNNFSGADVSTDKLISESLFFSGLYNSVEDTTPFPFEPEKYKELHLGVGYRYSISTNVDFFSVFSYELVKTYTGDDTETIPGYGIEAGIRFMLTEHLEVSTSLKNRRYARHFVTHPDFHLSISYLTSDSISVGLYYSIRTSKIQLSYLF